MWLVHSVQIEASFHQCLPICCIFLGQDGCSTFVSDPISCEPHRCLSMASEIPHSSAANAAPSSRGYVTTTSTDAPPKRLFVCCDGTWQDVVSTDYTLTNVARLSRCIKSVSSADDGTPIFQIVYYQTRIGRGTSRVGRAVDGLTGRGKLTTSLCLHKYIRPSMPIRGFYRHIHEYQRCVQLHMSQLQQG